MYIYDYALSKTIPYPKLIYIFFYPVFGTNSLCDRKYIMRGDGLSYRDCVLTHMHVCVCVRASSYNILTQMNEDIYIYTPIICICIVWNIAAAHNIGRYFASGHCSGGEFWISAKNQRSETHRTCSIYIYRSCYKHFFSSLFFFPLLYIRFTTI